MSDGCHAIRPFATREGLRSSRTTLKQFASSVAPQTFLFVDCGTTTMRVRYVHIVHVALVVACMPAWPVEGNGLQAPASSWFHGRWQARIGSRLVAARSDWTDPPQRRIGAKRRRQPRALRRTGLRRTAHPHRMGSSRGFGSDGAQSAVGSQVRPCAVGRPRHRRHDPRPASLAVDPNRGVLRVLKRGRTPWSGQQVRVLV